MAPVAKAYKARKARPRPKPVEVMRPPAVETEKSVTRARANVCPASPTTNVQSLSTLNVNTCPHCGNATLCFALHKSRCTSCGFTRVRHVVFKGAMAYSERIGIVAGNYRRYIHFRDILRKRTPTQPVNRMSTMYQNALKQVSRKLIAKGIVSSLDVNLRNVQRCAREANVKQHNVILHLTEDLSGVPLPQLTPFDYNRLYCMFQAMQGPFDRHKPHTRTNFLHYNHIAFRLLFLFGWDQWLYVYFWPMLGHSKVAEFDDLFAHMCSDPELDWEVCRTFKLSEARHKEALRQKSN